MSLIDRGISELADEAMSLIEAGRELDTAQAIGLLQAFVQQARALARQEMPRGWVLEVEKLPNGVHVFELRRPFPERATVTEGLGKQPLELCGNTYPSGGSWVEHESLVGKHHDEEGADFSEVIERDALRARAVFYAALADDLDARQDEASR